MRSVPNRNRKKKKKPLWFTFSRQRRIWSFHVVLQRTAKNCTMNHNARAKPSNLLFRDVLVAVAGVFCVRSLLGSLANDAKTNMNFLFTVTRVFETRTATGREHFACQGPVSRKPRKLFGPVKPFLVHLYLKTEKCVRLKLLV